MVICERNNGTITKELSLTVVDSSPVTPYIDLKITGSNIAYDSDFIYDICCVDGKLQYMLPADQTLYPRLAEMDPIYNDFFEFMNDENNGILRFGKHFYEIFPEREKKIMEILNS